MLLNATIVRQNRFVLLVFMRSYLLWFQTKAVDINSQKPTAIIELHSLPSTKVFVVHIMNKR